jgi:hypothetical protein
VLVVSPRPALPHQRAAYRLARQLDEQLLAGWDFVLEAEVVVQAGNPPTVRVPDRCGHSAHWVVDLDPPAPSITVYHLAAPGDGYVEEPAIDGVLETTVPFPLRIDTRP